MVCSLYYLLYSCIDYHYVPNRVSQWTPISGDRGDCYISLNLCCNQFYKMYYSVVDQCKSTPAQPVAHQLEDKIIIWIRPIEMLLGTWLLINFVAITPAAVLQLQSLVSLLGSICFL